MDKLRRKYAFFRHGLTRINTDKNIYPSVFSVSSVAKAFTIVEVLIVVAILGILAAVVVPLYEDNQQKAKESAAKENLRVLRNAIELYAAQHKGVAPGYPGGDISATPNTLTFTAQLTKTTNSSGAVSTTYSLGPYLPKIPPNPFNNKSNVFPIANSSSMLGNALGIYGYIYQPITKNIRLDYIGTDSEGKKYYEY